MYSMKATSAKTNISAKPMSTHRVASMSRAVTSLPGLPQPQSNSTPSELLTRTQSKPSGTRSFCFGLSFPGISVWTGQIGFPSGSAAGRKLWQSLRTSSAVGLLTWLNILQCVAIRSRVTGQRAADGFLVGTQATRLRAKRDTIRRPAPGRPHSNFPK